MPPKTKGFTRHARNTNNSSLYLVLKSEQGQLREVTSQVTPGSSEQLFDITLKDSRYEPSPSGSRRNVARTLKPCGACSDSKAKCQPLPDNPNLCVRCQSRKLSECPPHVPWSKRKGRGEQRQSSGSPQSQGSTQYYSPPLPEQIVAPPFPPPNPVTDTTRSPLQLGVQPRGQLADGFVAPETYPYMPVNNWQLYDHSIPSGAPGVPDSQLEPIWYFPHDPLAGQTDASYPPLVPYHQYVGNYGCQ